MIISTVAVGLVLIYLLSFVAADNQPSSVTSTDNVDDKDMISILSSGTNNNAINAKNNTIIVSNSTIYLSMADRVQLAQTIKDMLENDPEAGEAAKLSTDDLFDLLTRISRTPSLLSNADRIISAARNGNTSVIAGLVVHLLAAERPTVTSTPARIPPNLPLSNPVVSPVIVPSTASAAVLPVTSS